MSELSRLPARLAQERERGVGQRERGEGAQSKAPSGVDVCCSLSLTLRASATFAFLAALFFAACSICSCSTIHCGLAALRSASSMASRSCARAGKASSEQRAASGKQQSTCAVGHIVCG